MPERPPRRAAVVLPILAVPPYPVIFVSRAAHLRDHPGQIAFPGGSADAADGGDLRRTALRELDEELGIPAERVHIVAQLEEVHPITGRFRITPFVGVLAERTKLVIDPSETAEVHEVPLAAILAPGAVHEGIERVEERDAPSWLFDYGSLHVWGATARILRVFVSEYDGPDSSLRRELAAQRVLLGD